MSTAESTGEEEQWLQLHPRSVLATALVFAGLSVLAGVPGVFWIASATSLGVALGWVGAGAILLVGASAVYETVRVKVTRYRAHDTRLEMRTGIAFTRRRSLLRERIRSVDVSANPLYRVLGMVKVKVGTGETGSGAGSSTEQTLVIEPVTREEGDRLRALLLYREVVVGDESDDVRLATWSKRWLRYAPLSVLTPALAAVAVGGIFQVSDWLGRGGLPVEVVMDLVDDLGAWTVLALGFVASVLVGAVGSLIIQGEGWWGHRLDREPGGTLRVRRGLLVSRSLSLEEKRIRGVEIVEPLGVRLAGAARLDVVAIGLKSAAETGTDLSTLVPAAPRAVTLAAADAVLRTDERPELITHPTSARSRRFRWAAAGIAVLAAAVAFVHLVWGPSTFWAAVLTVVAVLLAVGALWMANDAYRALAHGLGQRHFVARRGSVRRSTVQLDRSGVIGWRIRQSVFQRRMGLLTVEATTAAGRGHYGAFDADEHEILDVAAEAVPDLLEPFLIRPGDAGQA